MCAHTLIYILMRAYIIIIYREIRHKMMNKHVALLMILIVVAVGLCIQACTPTSSGKQGRSEAGANRPCPAFVADSAMAYVRRQCDFGPRLTGSARANDCAEWIKTQFARMGCDVAEQQAQVTVWDGSTLPCRNIIASCNPQAGNRILLCAHWDTRPWADNDPDETRHHTPISGANDGASGVAVMMEIARQLSLQPLQDVGVDFVCFDAEDMGTPQWAEDEADGDADTWCLGSKVWAEQAAANGYRPRYGILLDMVGGRGSTFAKERVSMHYASHVVNRVWALASDLGYGQFFPSRQGGALVDDHVNVNTVAGIPCIDIVPYFEDGPSSFGPTWHTVSDTPENIDPNVLEAVGQTVLQLIYNEQ